MKIIVKVIFMMFVLLAGQAMAVTCTSNSSGDWKDNNWTPSDPCENGSSGPPAGSNVVIANGYNIKVDANTLAVANVTINAGGTLRGNGGDTLSLTGNFTNNGTFTANGGTVAFTGTAQTITGNVTFANVTVGASTVLTLAGNVTITGTVVIDTIVLANTCPTDYTLTAGAVVMHSCPTSLGAPIAEYRFDEGSAGSVTDSSGNNLSGTPNGGVAVGGSGQVCTGYNFNGSNAFVSVPNTALLNPTKITVAAWVRHNTATIKTWETILAKGDTTYRLHLLGQACSLNNKNTLGALTFGVNGGCAGADVSSGIVPVSGTWYHVVGTYDGATIKIYVNGKLQGSAAYAGTIASNTYPLYIGENAQQTGRYWSGDIDEVKIYGVALSAAQIAAGYANESAVPGKNWDGTARVCAATGPDHLEIQHGTGSGVTCAPSTLIIKACADTQVPCTAYTGGVSGTLSPTGAPNVNWVGGSGFSIGSSGSVAKSVQVTTVGSVLLGVTSPTTPAASSATTCNFGSPSPSCTFTASNAGFIFDVPHHVSEVLQTVNVSAVKMADNSLACVPAFAVSKNVMFKCSYANPASGTLPVRVNGTALNAAGTATGACDASGNTVSLAFDATGVASTTFQYADVGNISLTATYTGSGTDAGLVMTGSDSFIAAPKDFAFSAITPGPIKAGNNFSTTVTARNNANAATANFGKESAPAQETVKLTHAKFQPTGSTASVGIFSGAVGAFNNGAALASNLNWSEVGTIDITATLASGSYQGSGLNATGITGSAGAVGPFIPDHFITTVTDGCTGCGFTYSGQPFAVTVTAKNGLATPTTTVNYDGTVNTSPNFAQAVTLSAWDAATGATQNPGGSLLPAAHTAVPLSAFAQGVATRNADVSKPFFTFTTVPTAPTSIKVRAAETTATPAVTSSGFTEGSTEIRSGRMRLTNNYGSELLGLPVNLAAQYWMNASNGWVNSSTDSTTSFVVASPPATSAVSFSNFQKNLTAVSVSGSPSTITLAAGKGSFTLSAPGAGQSGSVDMSIPALTGIGCETAPPLLGCYLPSATARATFGIYKSPLIYRRENY